MLKIIKKQDKNIHFIRYTYIYLYTNLKLNEKSCYGIGFIVEYLISSIVPDTGNTIYVC